MQVNCKLEDSDLIRSKIRVFAVESYKRRIKRKETSLLDDCYFGSSWIVAQQLGLETESSASGVSAVKHLP